MKKLFILFFFSIITSLLLADVYEEFFIFKVKLYNSAGAENEESIFKEWDSHFSDMDLNEEDRLAVQNFVAIEKANLMKGAKSEKQIYKMLKEREVASLKYIEKKKRENVGKWFLLSFGDLKNRLLSYASWISVYSESTEAKKCVADALKKDGTLSPAYISQALWLFFAPVIAGGSYDGALKSLNSAFSCAKNDSERYLALVFRSQVHFKMGHTKECSADLKSASALVSPETFTKYIQKLNSEKGKVFFEK